ncbi:MULTISPECIES: hypothetical protein [unclassified Bosea (in: a-proteobacteria)]|uniref:hypothetical protein n=1 Tax=unclassified Bosea (in: a-proteobacteria) TaxID=2653178 RepID=UPI00125F17C2|nr:MULTISPECIES: hypothetical protein [unclassified Bosea (in: a-proteobacteria)]
MRLGLSAGFATALVICGMTTGSRPAAAITSLACTFTSGVGLDVDAVRVLATPARKAPETRRFQFSGLAGSELGAFRNVENGFEGDISIFRGPSKIDIVERADGSDNGFFVTIFLKEKVKGKLVAVLSQHSFAEGIDFYRPEQQIGTCE